MSDTISYLLRVWLPDRPGALGAVASRVGSVGGDIVAVDVVDRGGGQAVDDLVVELAPDNLDLMLREVRTVDGVQVEEVHTIGETPPDLGLGVLQAATALVKAAGPDELAHELCGHTRKVVRLEWAALCHTADGSLVAVSGEAPDAAWLGAYAMGVGPPPAPGHEIADAVAPATDPQIALAPLAGTPLILVAGRSVLSIRPRERALLEALVEVTRARWLDLASS
jgi:hypothetical protein